MIRSFFYRRGLHSCLMLGLWIAFLGCDSGDPVRDAKRLIDQGRAHAAIELLEPVVREQHDNLDAQFYYGVALTMTGEGGLAEWSLRRAMQDPARRERAGMMIVENALQGSNPEEAVKILSEMLEDDPDNVQLLLARADAYAKTRVNVDRVLSDVERVREIDPSNLEAERAEILGYLLAAMTEEAAAALEALGERIEKDPESESIDSWYCTTMALFAKESLDKELARERFDACVDMYPADGSVVVAATDFLREEHEIGRAIEILEHAMELDDGRVDSGFAPRLAELYFGQGRIDEAEALLIEATKNENLAVSLAYKLQLSELYESQGRLDDALALFEEAVAMMSDLRSPTAMAEFSLADLAIRAGQLDRALEIAEGLEHPPFRLMIEARVAQERGDHVRAMSLYDEAARLWPDNEYARYHAARSAEQIGDFDSAIELYRHATRISVETTNAMSRIALLLYASGRPGEAYELLLTQQQRAPLDEIGELLKVELMVLLGELQQIPGYLGTIEQPDTIGVAPRLARVFRALRLRGESKRALDFAARGDPRVFAARGGDRALEELILASEGRPEDLDRVVSILERAEQWRPEAAGLKAVRGLLAERQQQEREVVVAAYKAALELDPSQPLALVGLARALIGEDAGASLSLATRALAAETFETQRITALAVELMDAGAQDQALELFRLVLERTPYDGVAAQELASAALAAGDHSGRTLDLARRAARFARTERSLSTLLDTYEARGDKDRADEITARLERYKRRLEAESSAKAARSADRAEAG